MASPKGKLAALLALGLGISTIAVAGFACRGLILEQWHLWGLERGDEAGRMAAAKRLGEMRSVRAAPLLIERLKIASEERTTRVTFPHYAQRALAQIGEGAFPALFKLLDAEEPRMQRLALETLLLMGHESDAAAPAVIHALGSSQAAVRLGAAQALTGMGQAAVPGLVHTLKDGKDRVRASAATVLGAIGPVAGAVPALLEALLDPSEEVSWASVHALRRIGFQAGVVPSLLETLKRADASVRPRVRAVLAGLGPAAVPEIAGALGDGDPEVRRTAARALWAIGSDSQGAVPALAQALEDQDPEVREEAAAALKRIRRE